METRAVFELGVMAATSPWLRLLGRGDHHPVLVMPGFMTSDRSTLPLRSILRSNGYWVHGWQLGTNIGPTSRVADGMIARLEQIYERHQQPVSIIGWSLGGIYARRVARERTEMVRQVITLGSPFRILPNQRSAASDLFDMMKSRHVMTADDLIAQNYNKALPVPATAIYSRTDGVVRWWQCIDRVGPQAENIEVYGSHSGLGFNPAVTMAVLDRLAQPIDDWRPFAPPMWARHLFPRPADWNDEYAEIDLAEAG